MTKLSSLRVKFSSFVTLSPLLSSSVQGSIPGECSKQCALRTTEVWNGRCFDRGEKGGQGLSPGTFCWASRFNFPPSFGRLWVAVTRCWRLNNLYGKCSLRRLCRNSLNLLWADITRVFRSPAQITFVGQSRGTWRSILGFDGVQEFVCIDWP